MSPVTCHYPIRVISSFDRELYILIGLTIRVHFEILFVEADNSVSSGSKVAIDIVVKNLGRHELDDLIVQASISELGISNLNRENILCTYGGQEGLQLAFSSFVSCDNEGRIVGGPRVLGFDPIWSCMLENILPYSGSSIGLVPFIEQRGNLDVDFETLERRLSEADILYLNNPHNPTGKVFSAEELREIN